MTLQIKEIEKPLRAWSYSIAAYNLMLLKASLSHPFEVFNEKATLWSKIISEKLPWLVKTEKALRVFKERIDRIEGIQALYLNMREAHGRTPSDFITDIRVMIPDSNRDLEYRIYAAFGEFLRTSRPLLFDLHIIKLRGREPEEVVSEEFWRYEWTSNRIF